MMRARPLRIAVLRRAPRRHARPASTCSHTGAAAGAAAPRKHGASMALQGGSCRACCSMLEKELLSGQRRASSSEPDAVGDPVFAVESNTVRYGPGAIRELGDAARHALGLRSVVLFTDGPVRATPTFEAAERSLKEAGVAYTVFDRCRTEPTDGSFKEASEFLVRSRADGIVSVGGGSVMDTAKAAQLYSSLGAEALAGDWHETFLDYVNAPIGRAKQPDPSKIVPHIACPTTSGTGSESTGLAIFDLTSMHAKTAVASKSIRPSLALVDPDSCNTLPPAVCAASSFDVLSHALESYTARPHTERPLGRPRSEYSPSLHRPMAQGRNAYSDVGCLEALRLGGRYMVRAVRDASDTEARERMMFASLLAGIAFGNCGVAIPHGLSYAVSGLARRGEFDGYPPESFPIVPHGFSVVLGAPSAFRFTAPSCPERHLDAAVALGAEAGGATLDDAGEVLANRLIELMRDSGHVPNGLRDVGLDDADVDDLVAGALPQRRVLDNAPMPIYADELRTIFKGAMSYW